MVFTGQEVSLGAVSLLLAKLGLLEATKRQLIFAEFLTRLSIKPLSNLRPLYPGFEDELWAKFMQDGELESHAYITTYISKASVGIQEKYYKYIRSMLAKSAKTRDEFHNEILMESGIHVELGEIDFGRKAVAFAVEVMGSVHREQLMLWYVMELLKNVYVGLEGNSHPISEQVLSACYHFLEQELPLFEEKFERYTANPSALQAIIKEHIPQSHSPKSFTTGLSKMSMAPWRSSPS